LYAFPLSRILFPVQMLLTELMEALGNLFTEILMVSLMKQFPLSFIVKINVVLCKVSKGFAIGLKMLSCDKILNYVLNGEGFFPGYNGITPPTFPNYKTEEIKGYKLNTDSAKYYLAKAGYPGGKGFPEITLQLNSEGERNSNVAIEIQKQLKENLNINIKLEVLPFAQHVENIISGKATFFRSGYIADYPSPENFLSLFYGKNVPPSLKEKSFPNFARYINPEFDRFYEAGLTAKTTEEAYQYFLEAEKILMDDAPIVVLWYDEGYRLLQSNVKNFPNNPMQLRDYSEVYFDKVKTASEM